MVFPTGVTIPIPVTTTRRVKALFARLVVEILQRIADGDTLTAEEKLALLWSFSTAKRELDARVNEILAKRSPCQYRHRQKPVAGSALAMHLGHAFSALTAYDAAQAEGGEFILRIEDIDHTRCRPTFETAIYEDLAALRMAFTAKVAERGPASA